MRRLNNKRSIRVLLLGFVAFLIIFICSDATAEFKTKKPAKIPGWYLIWHDEFEGNTLDPFKWRVEDAALIKNNELQYYTPEDVYVHDGVLTLRSQKRQMGGRHYTSGLVETKGKFAQAYGRFEVRAKLPGTRGMWPAHWMMPAAGGWPPEIDIMELVGHRPNSVIMSNHYGTWPHNRHEGTRYTGPDFTKGFHTFAIEWEPEEIRWYVDGVQRFSTRKNIPQEPFYIILNTAVGGNLPGNPDKTTVFPQYHDIDYVRVYAKEIKGTYFLMVCADDGSVVVTPEKDRYKRGTRVKIKAMPKIGYKFSHWSGDVLADGNPAIITMNRHKKIAAHFVIDPDAPQLLSKDKPATASSAENQSFLASNVVDGKINTRWSSEFFDPQWVYIDLGKIHTIEAVRLEWEAAYAKGYKIQVSDNASEWKTVYSTENGTGGTEEKMDLNTSGRYVRMYGTTRGTKYGYSLWEFEVYGRGRSGNRKLIF